MNEMTTADGAGCGRLARADRAAEPPLAATVLRPPLKWAGGKRWLVPYLAPLWASHHDRRLVEPFCGGLAVTLGLGPARALLNDINPHLISFYRYLQGGLQITTDMRNERELYYQHRAAFNALITAGQAETRAAAELFYFLNRTGYNGLCRYNRLRGHFNVPFGRYRRIRYTSDLSAYAPVLRRWDFSAHPFHTLAVQDDDFIYADPPYDVPFRQYAREGFTWDDQVRLAHWLHAHRGPVVLSNQATPRILDLYIRLGFTIRLLEAPRMISRTGDRTPAQEVLATRNL